MPKKGKSRKHGNVLVSSKATYGQVKAPDMNSNGGASANQPDDDDDDDDDYENPPPKPVSLTAVYYFPLVRMRLK